MVEHAESSEHWLRHTLEEILGQIRRLLDPNGCAFVVVDWEEGVIRPVAAWFESDEMRAPLAPMLARPYEPERAGVIEAAVEEGRPLLIPRIDDWPGADRLRERVEERLSPDAARAVWDWYRGSSFISCPVRTAGGRTLGVLALSTCLSQRQLGPDDLQVIEVFADLAALALERSELLAGEARRAQEELDLNRAARAVTRSLMPDVVYAAIVEQAARLTGAEKALLARLEPAAAELRVVAAHGFSARVRAARFGLAEGMIGRVARTGKPHLGVDASEENVIRWVADTEGIASYLHMPIKLGPRLFGVLNVSHSRREYFDAGTVRVLGAFARAAAAAIANALDYQRERRMVDALARSFVPGPPPQLPDHELGLVYEPAGHELGGGDIFGAWTLPDGRVAVLVGDLGGKGLEAAAQCAMVRFFIEARTWDCDRPAEVLAQTSAALRRRGAGECSVPAFLAILGGRRIRYCNASHPPPRVLHADGDDHELTATGLPLGARADGRYTDAELPFAAGDVLFAATDGLVDARRGDERFGDERLPQLLAAYAREVDPEELVRLVHRDAERWVEKLHDDIVILGLRR